MPQGNKNSSRRTFRERLGPQQGTSNAHDNYYLAEPYLKGIQSGEFTTAELDELGNEVMDIPYNKGIFVGYRFIDKNKLKPTFPFGHGLSYTSYEYGKATIDTDKIRQKTKKMICQKVVNIMKFSDLSQTMRSR